MDTKGIIFREYDKYRRSMLDFQEQHQIIFGDKSKSCDIILENVHHFVSVLINKINEEYEEERGDQQITEEPGS